MSKNNLICEKDQCTGCAACVNCCPKGAISMNAWQGFLYPEVDKSKCLNCGKCSAICPVVNKYPDSGEEPIAYGVKNKDVFIREKSSSGGVFALLAQYVLQGKGVVYAPVYDRNYDVRHKAIDSENGLFQLLGSKYVQSDVGDSYKHIKARLNQGEKVLFSGTPCQVAGLMKFLGREYPNLLTVDIICHGVPSPDSWRKYLAYRTRKAGAEISQLVFREKQSDGSAALFLRFSNNGIYRCTYNDDPYIRSFLSNLNLRTACTNCSFKHIHRCSDITLGDFWGVEKYCPQLVDNRGASIVLLHSERGKDAFDAIRSETIYAPVNFRDAVANNPSYLHSTKENVFRKQFLCEVNDTNFEGKVHHYSGNHMTAKLHRILKRFVSHAIR